MSAIFELAAGMWREMHYDYSKHIDAAYLAALEGCGAVLVNKAGRAIGVDGYDLFTGPGGYAAKYASEELMEWWQKHPRLTLARYEIQWLKGRGL